MNEFRLKPDPLLPLADDCDCGLTIKIVSAELVPIDQAIADAIFDQGRQHEREQFPPDKVAAYLAGIEDGTRSRFDAWLGGAVFGSAITSLCWIVCRMILK